MKSQLRKLNLKKLIPLIVVGVFVFSFGYALAADYWVSNPDNCPATDVVNFPGQNCDTEMICGDLGGIAQCYDTSILNPPLAPSSVSQDWSSSYDGGYIFNCYDTDSAPDPYCDNDGGWWCDSNSACYDIGRDTTCIGGEAASSTCSTCRTGYVYCDGSYVDVDGCEIRYDYDNCDELATGTNENNNVNSGCQCVCDAGYLDCDNDDTDSNTGTGNCEVENGGACMVGILPGTYNGCSCEVDKSYFETGTETSYSSSDPLLWGAQYGSGPLMQLLNYNASTTGGMFYIDNDGKVGIGTSAPSAMLTVGIDSGFQFLVNSTGVVTDGTWHGDTIGLNYGGTGASLSDPNANKLMYWNDTASSVDWIATNTLNIALSDTTGTLQVSRGGTGATTL
ncbi:hypothetical protein DRH27_05720, partial [Candidatus Falkowbacteria bacterium]